MKSKKNKLTNLLKTGILFLGISLLLWNCEKQDNFEINVPQSKFTVPTIEKTQSNFQQNFLFENAYRKSTKTVNLDVDWEKSIPKNFKNDINILYTPIHLNTSVRIKSLIASVNNEDNIESYVLTIAYDEESTNEAFSGSIFKHDINGNLVAVYQYKNGSYIQTLAPTQSKESGYARRSSSCSTSVLDVVMSYIYGYEMLDCISIGGGGGNGGSFGSSSSNSSWSWSNPNNNLTNNNDFGTPDFGGGSGGAFGGHNNGGSTGNNSNGDTLNTDGVDPWWAEVDKIINELTDPCAKDIFTELENGIYQDDPIKPEVEILAINTDKLNFSEEILHLFASSKETNFTIKNGNLTGANASTDPLTNTTTLSNSYLNNATELSIARTMIHEQVHAYINSVLKSKPGFRDMDLQTRMREYARDKGITDTYKFHHEFMGQYVNGIALSLYEWDKDYGNGKGLNYNTKPDDLLGWNYYKALAWGGLFQTNPNTGLITSLTDSFKELIPNEIDRQKIADIVVNELKNNNDAKGTKCN